MRFQLPQFIETEIKIVGPFTLRQFLWIAGGTALIFLLFVVFKSIWSFILAVPVVIFSLAFAFVKIHDVPLIEYVAYFLSYTLNPKRYVYTHEKTESGAPEIPTAPPEQTPPTNA